METTEQHHQGHYAPAPTAKTKRKSQHPVWAGRGEGPARSRQKCDRREATRPHLLNVRTGARLPGPCLCGGVLIQGGSTQQRERPTATGSTRMRLKTATPNHRQKARCAPVCEIQL